MSANMMLHWVDVSDNLLEDIPPINALHLTHLNVRGNRLKQLPGRLASYNLHVLDISNNQLTSIEPVGRLRLIFALCAANNSLQELPELRKLKYLHEVTCEGNPLQEIPVLNPRFIAYCDCCHGRDNFSYAERRRHCVATEPEGSIGPGSRTETGLLNSKTVVRREVKLERSFQVREGQKAYENGVAD